MVSAKTQLFDKELREASVLFKALAHPARLAIIKYLAETKTCMSGNISDVLPLSRTTVNQHLNELKSAGLIKGSVEGTKVNYCLNIDNINTLHKLTYFFFKEVQAMDKKACES